MKSTHKLYTYDNLVLICGRLGGVLGASWELLGGAPWKLLRASSGLLDACCNNLKAKALKNGSGTRGRVQ